MDKFTIKFKVTKRDKARGRKASPDSCPIALGLGRALRTRFRRWRDVEVWAYADRLSVHVGGRAQTFRPANTVANSTPEQLRNWMYAFDGSGHGSAEPFEYELELVRSSVGV